MKRLFIFVFILSISTCTLYAETGISGVIDKTVVWSQKDSPYVISERTVIGKKGFLKIQPGVEVKFKEEGELVVQGALYAKGSPKNPIRFLPYDGKTFYKGLRFEGKYKNTVEFVIMIRGTIVVEGSKLNLTNSYILNASGVELFHFASAYLKNNYFYNNTYGVYIEGKKIGYRIESNTFTKCRFAVYIKKAENSAGLIKNNNFSKSKVNLTNYTPGDIKAADNYWGVRDEKNVLRTLYGKKNNKKTGHVLYKPYSKNPYKLFTPPPAFVSLVKQYLKLKREDDKLMRISVGSGAAGFMPVTSESWKKEADFGMGMGADFTLTISPPFVLGVEGRIISMVNKDKTNYDYSFDATNLMAGVYWYIGYSQKAYFMPYFKLSNGVSMISETYKVPGFDTVKLNEICYNAAGGMGAEYFLGRNFSLKLEAMYNFTLSANGNISYVLGALSGNVYFDLPFVLNN